MLNVFIDIETIPNQKQGAFEAILQDVALNFKAPSDLTKEKAAADLGITDKDEIKFTSKASMIERWEAAMASSKSHEVAEDKYRRTALNGGYGEVCVIGLAVDDGEPEAITDEDEAEILVKFNQLITRIKYDVPRPNIRFIGHNVEFDIRFLFHRFIVNRIKPAINLHYSQYSENFADTMQIWAGRGNRIKLAELCEILRIPSPKDGIDGSQVWDYVQAGRIEEVAEYCKKDVIATREAYNRMTFQF